MFILLQLSNRCLSWVFSSNTHYNMQFGNGGSNEIDRNRLIDFSRNGSDLRRSIALWCRSIRVSADSQQQSSLLSLYLPIEWSLSWNLWTKGTRSCATKLEENIEKNDWRRSPSTPFTVCHGAKRGDANFRNREIVFCSRGSHGRLLR